MSCESDPRSAGIYDRDGELATIHRLVDELPQAVPAVLLIEGAAGIGKTTLLNQVAIAARRHRARVLVAAGRDDECDVAFGVAGQLLRSSTAPGSDNPATNLPGATGGSPEETLDALDRELLHIARGGPLVLAVDDLQLADTASLRWLARLPRRLRDVPVLIAAVAQHTEAPHLTPLLADLRDHPTGTVLRPGPLRRNSTDQWLAQRLEGAVDDDFGATCRLVTGGNPFLFNELLRVLDAEGIPPVTRYAAQLTEYGPAGVAQWVTDRLRRHSPHAVDVANALAVLNGGGSPRLVAPMCSIELATAVDTITLLTRAGIIRQAGAHGFVHPMVQTALYRQLRATRRQELHRRAARLLAAQDAAPEQIADHLLLAGPSADPGTVDLLRRIADDVTARGDVATARSCLQHAMQGSMSPTQRGLLALQLGETLMRHDVPAAATYLEYAWTAVRHRDHRRRAGRLLAYGLTTTGAVQEAIDLLARYLEQTHQTDPALSADLYEQRRTLRLLHADTVPIGEPAEPDTGGLEPGRYGRAAIRTAWRGRHRDTALHEAHRAILGGALSADDPITVGCALEPLLLADELTVAHRHLEEVEQHREPIFDAELAALHSQLALREGDVGLAEKLARIGLAAVESGRPAPVLREHRAVLVDALLERGQYDEAAEVFRQGRYPLRLPREWRYNHLLESRGRLRIARGDLHGGLADLLECGRRLAGWGVDNPAANSWRRYAVPALAELGDRRQARDLAERDLAAAHAWGAARGIGAGQWTAALLCGGEDRIRELTAAVEMLQDAPSDLELAYALVDLGVALRDVQRQDQARDELRRGLDLAQRCGATRLAERAHNELVRAGARPRRRAQSGLGALTATERRIATMAAEGHTNRQIAETLFVSQRAIELHLTNVYRKLHIVGRTALAGVLKGRVGIIDTAVS